MKHLYKICLILGIIPVLLLFTNASTGPGANFGSGFTNAPFDGTYCINCHGGGNFTPSVNIELQNGSTPVSNYSPNTPYNLHIDVSSSTGVTPTTHYGFQVVSVLSSNNANAGAWGSLTTTDYHDVTINGRDYVEHNNPLSSGSIDIPWTSPPAGSGAVVFYAAGNVVNLDFGTTGDNPTFNSLTVPVNPLPATWLYFNGKKQGATVLLEWSTSKALSDGSFKLERSSDGVSFRELASVKARNTGEENSYSWPDVAPEASNFYRISHKGANGQESYFKTIQVTHDASASGIAYVRGGQLIVMLSGMQQEEVTASIHSLDGKLVSRQTAAMKQGNNTLFFEKPGVDGIYMVTVRSGSRILYSGKFLAE